jgi:choline dehydrogenase-like flavoprotein
VTFSHHENDRRLIAHSIGSMSAILQAAGGTDVWDANRTSHLMGTCRMGSDPATSVVEPSTETGSDQTGTRCAVPGEPCCADQ